MADVYARVEDFLLTNYDLPDQFQQVCLRFSLLLFSAPLALAWTPSVLLCCLLTIAAASCLHPCLPRGLSCSEGGVYCPAPNPSEFWLAHSWFCGCVVAQQALTETDVRRQEREKVQFEQETAIKETQTKILASQQTVRIIGEAGLLLCPCSLDGACAVLLRAVAALLRSASSPRAS